MTEILGAIIKFLIVIIAWVLALVVVGGGIKFRFLYVYFELMLMVLTRPRELHMG